MYNFHVQCGGLTPEQKEMIKQKAIECVKKEGASDADLQTMMSHNPPTTHEGKCVAACMAEASGAVSDLLYDTLNEMNELNFL